MLRAALDILVFSSAWLAAAAGALCVASSLAMGLRPAFSVVAVVCAGTLVVYSVDRLRDLERDRTTTPVRSAFIRRHARAMKGLGLASGVVAITLGAVLGTKALVLLVLVFAVGLAHRRLKRIPFVGAAYIAAAWLLVVVGLPAIVAGGASNAVWVAAILGVTLLASTIVSDVRDVGASLDRLGPEVALQIARALAVVGIMLAALAPPVVRPLIAVPVFTLASVIWFRPGERYGLVVVDGALLAGALAAIGILAFGLG